MTSSRQSSARKGPSEVLRSVFPSFLEPSTAIDPQSQSAHRVKQHKSRPPEAKNIQRRATPDASTSSIHPFRKQKKSFNVSLTVNGNDHPKNKPRSSPFIIPTQSRNGVQNALVGESSARKESSRSRESQKWSTASALTTASSDRSDMPANLAEIARLRSDIEQLRKQTQSHRKVVEKLNEELSRSNRRSSQQHQALKDKETQLTTMKANVKKFEDVIANIETNLLCQICMELMFKPYALSPCGHVLCLHCLQEWFRKAPPGDDEMDNENPDDPDYLIYRRKSCPVCRGQIKHRPVPVFMVKSIVAAVTKVKGNGPAKQSPPVDSDTDVWAGLFPDVNDESDEDDRDDEDDDDDDDDDHDEGDNTDYSDDNDYSDEEVFPYGTDSEAESYTGRYVNPCWEPPFVCFDPNSEAYAHLGMSAEEFAMYRRGATLSMITKYQMHYSHNEGLVAHLADHIIHLGWNVRISADDPDGEKFMNWIMEDIFANPARWNIRRDGVLWKGSRLVREDDQDFYSTTDSGEWDFRDDFL